MTVRDKDGLREEVLRLIDTAGTPMVSAEDMRLVLRDFVDSFALQSDVEAPVSHVAFAGWVAAPPRDVVVADFDTATEGSVDNGVVIPALPLGQAGAWLWFAVPLADPYGYPLHTATGGFRQPDGAFVSMGNALVHDSVTFAIGQSANPLIAASVGLTISWEFENDA